MPFTEQAFHHIEIEFIEPPVKKKPPPLMLSRFFRGALMIGTVWLYLAAEYEVIC